MKYIVNLFIWLLIIKIKFKLIINQFDLLKYINKKIYHIDNYTMAIVIDIAYREKIKSCHDMLRRRTTVS